MGEPVQHLVQPVHVILAELGCGINSLRYPLPDGSYVLVLNKLRFKTPHIPRQRGAATPLAADPPPDPSEP